MISWFNKKKNEQYYGKVLFSTFDWNGHASGFHPEIQRHCRRVLLDNFRLNGHTFTRVSFRDSKAIATFRYSIINSIGLIYLLF